MYKKLQGWMDDLDQKKMEMERLSDRVRLPIYHYDSKDGYHFSFKIGDTESVDDIMELQKLSYGEDIPWQYKSVWHDLAYNPKAFYILAYAEDGTPAAFIGSWLVEEDAHITNLCVNPKYQRQGLARYLMDLLKEIAIEMDMHFLSLEVRVSNNIAQQLYIRYGFKPTRLIKEYYKNNQEDAIKMVKRIRPKLDGN